MATTNPDINSDWTLIVAAGSDFLLSLPQAELIEVAVTATETAPAVAHGHVLDPIEHEGLTRALVGPGYVWARSIHADIPVAVALTTWSA